MFCRAFYYCASSTTCKHFSPFAFPLWFHVRLHHGEFFTFFSCDYNKFTFDCALPTWKASRFVTMCKFMCIRCFSITWALFYVVNVPYHPSPPPPPSSSLPPSKSWLIFEWMWNLKPFSLTLASVFSLTVTWKVSKSLCLFNHRLSLPKQRI